MIYADYNATAPMRPEAREALLVALDLGPSNPSSVHQSGRAARAVVEKARSQIGGAIGSRAEDIIFTSGGTESLALAVHGAVLGLGSKATLIVSAIEHEATSKAAAHAGVLVETAYVGPDGRIDL
ncbi:MAG: aminotransferase class V-fold PLP-dependent enzyme, partial [Alphaproteobacteria bacterium]|nr:aminotransferase class V-fold PLP-dependent enzyme [Alphaproteobacteria bacterium]